MLQIQNLHIQHKKDLRTILENFGFTLNPGEKAVIIGEEGNGKSTLLRWIYDPVLVESYVEVSGLRILSGERLGYLPQELPEQEITAVFTDREQVEALLKALYSEELSWIAGEEFGTVDRDVRYTVQIFLSEEGRKAREKEPTLCLIRSLEPEFVERTIRERAVYE